MRWLKQNKLILAFAVINFMIVATPANAGQKEALCQSGGDEVPCCVSCLFFCGCDIE